MAKLDATQEFVPRKPGISGRQGQSPEVGWEVAMRFMGKFPANLNSLHSPQFNWRSGTPSTVLEQERLIERLTGLYRFDDVSVSRFLRENPFLLDLLIEAHKKIQQYFGPHTQVTLEVFTDPEAEDFQQLFALVHASPPLEEEDDPLENLYDEWWLDTLPAALGKMIISVE